MPDKSQKSGTGTGGQKKILFKCKFCGKSKPLSEMIVMRQYFPQIPSCRDCAKDSVKKEEPPEENA